MTAPRVPDRSSTGVDPAFVAACAYLVGAITGIIVLGVERESRFVRFHAVQSIALSIGVMLLTLLVGSVPVVGRVLMLVTWVGATVVWLGLMWAALNGRAPRLPYVGQAIDERVR